MGLLQAYPFAVGQCDPDIYQVVSVQILANFRLGFPNMAFLQISGITANPVTRD
jgi:hypothetical protein